MAQDDFQLSWRKRTPGDGMSKYYFIYAACLGVIMIAIAIMLSGCIVTAVTEKPAYYTRYEMDAINAETACRQLARTIIQMERCAVRR